MTCVTLEKINRYPLCIHCSHHRESVAIIGTVKHIEHTCIRGVSVVDGSVVPYSCNEYRSKDEFCGIAGKYFEL